VIGLFAVVGTEQAFDGANFVQAIG